MRAGTVHEGCVVLVYSRDVLVHNGLSESGCVCASFYCGWWIYVGGLCKFTMIYETFKRVFVSV